MIVVVNMKGYRHKWKEVNDGNSKCDKCGMVYPTKYLRTGGLGACRRKEE